MTNPVLSMGSCDDCGSSDAKATYIDHTYCFSCTKWKPIRSIDGIRKRVEARGEVLNTEGIPNLNRAEKIPPLALKWIMQYGLTMQEIKDNDIFYDDEKELLVLIHNKEYFQGRNFDTNSKLKYMSRGKKPRKIYGTGDTLVLTEDVISAIKVARLEGYCAMAVLGSSLSSDDEKVLVQEYKKILVYLDRDKSRNAMLIQKRLIMNDVESRVIISEKDPKAYNNKELLEYLNC